MRFDSYTQKDTQDAGEGDVFFQGIDMTRDKPIVQQGMITLGENTRTRTGHVLQRPGSVMAPDFNPAETIGPIIGSGVFRNPNGGEVLLVAPQGATYTWALVDGGDPYKINYAGPVTGNNGTGRVAFVQAFEKVLLLRSPLQGTPAENLIWDGTGDLDGNRIADTQWSVAPVPSAGDPAPGVWDGEPFMDRVIYYSSNSKTAGKRDTWYLSDVLDYTSTDAVFQTFRTNAGDADKITRIMAYFRGSVVIFKNHSIHMATLQPTFPVTITQRILNSSLGSIGRDMPLMIGGDILFMSQPNGIYRLSEVIQDQITTLPVPVSEPIQAIIDDIHWPRTGVWGCSAALGNYAFFGVSLSSRTSSGRLNAILVFDTQRKQWESAGDVWMDPNFSFSALHVTNYAGVHRLFAVDYLTGVTYLLYEGVTDETLNGKFGVPFKMESRGYSGGDPISFKRFGRAALRIKTSDPLITVTAITDGFNEEKVLTPEPITKDRTRFYTHGHAAFDPDTDDLTEPKREDYSVVTDDTFIGEDYETIPVGLITSIPPTLPATTAEDQQESLERLIVRSFGTWVSLRIENDRGTCEVSALGVESTRSLNTNRTAA